VKIKATYDGNLRTSLKHLLSSQEIKTDAPLDNQGKGEFFSPTDLLCSSLASCMLTIMAIAANKHEVDIKGAYIEVAKKMSLSPRMIASIKLDVNFKQGFSGKHRLVLERAALSCPVHRSLSSKVNIDINFNYLLNQKHK